MRPSPGAHPTLPPPRPAPAPAAPAQIPNQVEPADAAPIRHRAGDIQDDPIVLDRANNIPIQRATPAPPITGMPHPSLQCPFVPAECVLVLMPVVDAAVYTITVIMHFTKIVKGSARTGSKLVQQRAHTNKMMNIVLEGSTRKTFVSAMHDAHKIGAEYAVGDVSGPDFHWWWTGVAYVYLI